MTEIESFMQLCSSSVAILYTLSKQRSHFMHLTVPRPNDMNLLISFRSCPPECSINACIDENPAPQMLHAQGNDEK